MRLMLVSFSDFPAPEAALAETIPLPALEIFLEFLRGSPLAWAELYKPYRLCDSDENFTV
jgi:hypothetical protein